MSAFLIATGAFLLHSSALPPLLGERAVSSRVADLTRTGKLIILVTGFTTIVERLLPTSLVIYKSEFLTQEAVTAIRSNASYTFVDDALRAFSASYVVEAAGLDIGLASLIFLGFAESAFVPSVRTAVRYTALAAATSFAAYVTVGLYFMVDAQPFESILLVLTSILATFWFSGCIWFLYLAWCAESRAAEGERLRWVDHSDPAAKWVERTARVRLLLTGLLCTVLLLVIQFTQVFLYSKSGPAQNYPRFAAVIDNNSIVFRALVVPLTIIYADIAAFASGEAHFQMLRTKHEEAKRANAYRIINRYVCHEVRVSLSSVALGIDLVADTVDDSREPDGGVHLKPRDAAECADTLANMQTSTHIVSRILNDVLQAEALEQGRMRLEPAPFSPASFLRRVQATADAQATAKGVRLTARLSLEGLSEGVRLFGDEDRLVQVTSNLLSNAVKFTPPHRAVHLQVFVSKRSDEALSGRSALSPRSVDDERGGRIMFTVIVRDEGVGIRQEDLPLLFRPFQQLAAGSVYKGASSGLGLSICKGIVQAFGGSIRASSLGEGLGSSFSFDVPLTECESRRSSPASPVSSDSVCSAVEVYSAEAIMARMPCLVVDDNEVDRELLSGILLRMGFAEVSTASTIDQALREASQLKHHRRVLTIVNGNMGGGEGNSHAVMRAVAAALGDNVLLVVAMDHVPKDHARLIGPRPFAVIEKPVSREGIRKLMQRFRV